MYAVIKDKNVRVIWKISGSGLMNCDLLFKVKFTYFLPNTLVVHHMGVEINGRWSEKLEFLEISLVMFHNVEYIHT